MELGFLFKDAAAQETARALVQADSCEFRLSAKYRLYYRLLRPVMPIFVRQWLQRSRKIETEERWYEPIQYMQSISESLAEQGNELSTIHPWPDNSEFAFVLTHDVETSEGMRHIARIADFEESLGLRSSWNLVPYKYKIDMGLVKDLQSRGFEIGIHGYNHDGQLYSSHRLFQRRAVAINDAIRKYNAVGFRSPMVHRNLNWLQDLEIEYDSSCFDIDPFQAAPGGVGSIWPFIAGKFVELPYTLPQDHTLFVGLGEQDDRIWKSKLDYIVRHQGMALMLTHPDYLTGHRTSEIYFRFLEFVKDIGNYWHATPMDVSRWWRERERAIEFGAFGKPDSSNGQLANRRTRPARLQLDGDSFQFVATTV